MGSTLTRMRSERTADGARLLLGLAVALSLACHGGEADTDGTGGTDGTDVLVECDAAIGRVEPLAVCTSANPCDRPATGGAVTDPSPAVTCGGGGGDRPIYDDGPPVVTTDADGVPRRYCLFVPEGASAESLPLVVFFHGAGGAASDVYDFTSLRTKAEGYDLGGTGDGFVLASVQGRNLHWPTEDPRDGAHHDIYHRDLRSPSGNPDIANADQIIDNIVSDGIVDPSRIYVMGWSNGGFFAQEYGIARHETQTPGGNRVAAVAVFSAADPFQTTSASAEPSCRLDPYPTSEVPIRLTTRACDIVACDAAQAADFVDGGHPVAPGFIVEDWVDDLENRVGATDVEWQRVRGNGEGTDRCTAPAFCLWAGALVNHVRWPDGIADGSGVDHEAAMLEYLAAHPL